MTSINTDISRSSMWFDSEEAFLCKLEKQCNIYHNHYTKEYKYYHDLSSKFNIPILIISSINALSAIALSTYLRQKIVSILNAVLSAGTGVLGSIQLYLKLNEKITNALRSSIIMKRLALKIAKELQISRELRSTEGQTFMQECFSDFNTTLESGNPIEIKIPNHLAFTSKELANKALFPKPAARSDLEKRVRFTSVSLPNFSFSSRNIDTVLPRI